jgi:hypothetical protein
MAGQLLHAKPMNIKEIAAKAQDFEFNPFIALKYWIRTADTLYREVIALGRRKDYADMIRHKSTSTKTMTSRHIFC